MMNQELKTAVIVSREQLRVLVDALSREFTSYSVDPYFLNDTGQPENDRFLFTCSAFHWEWLQRVIERKS